MKSAVIVFPGSNCDRDLAVAIEEVTGRAPAMVWHRDADLPDGTDFIALPGGWGTLEEFFEVLTWAQLGLHRKPCGLLNVRGFFDGLLSFIDHSIDERFVRRENRSMVIVSSAPGTLLELFNRYVPPVVEKWIDDAST